jgi:hypothetical protein
VSAQLSLLDAAAVDRDTGSDHQWLPGEDIAADIDAVLAYVPKVGHRHGTAREKSLRPLAYVYARTALLEPAERKIVQGIARACTGFVDEHDGIHHYTEWMQHEGEPSPRWTPQSSEEWARLSGGAGRDGREATRRVLPADRSFPWAVGFLASDHAIPKVKAWREQVRPHLRTLGCDPGKRKAITLPSLAPLILALRWSPALEAAVFLAGSGIAPKSDEWAVHVDLALACGRPWSEALAVLSARHPRDVVIRALAWVHAHGMQRRAVR